MIRFIDRGESYPLPLRAWAETSGSNVALFVQLPGQASYLVAEITSDGKLDLSLGIGPETGLCLDDEGRIVIAE